MARSTTSPAGVDARRRRPCPREIVSGTESVAKNGPPLSAIVWPVGAVESALIVIVAVAV